LADGPLGFSALRNRVDGVSKPVLSDALEALTEDGVVERRVVSESPYRVEYALTDAGRDLEAVVRALREWGESYASAEGC
jgi:DNA-binding HxlR family transcriptional regulator